MRDAFPEYYPLSPSEVRACIVDGTVVLDTNILFALYRFSTAEREQLLQLLGQVHERLWVPHQVALEYQRTRESVIRSQAGQYEKVVGLVTAVTVEKLTATLRGLALPDDVRTEAETLIAEYVEAATEAAEPFAARAHSLVAKHVVTQEQGRTGDPVRARLDKFLAGKVGPRSDDTTREARIKEALVRYAAATPPGFKDDKKDTDELRAGDYLLWRELLDHVSTLDASASVLFVTADDKRDWFTRDGDPLPALRREFAEHSPATYHQVSLPDFLRLANEHLDSNVSSDTITRADHIVPRNWVRRNEDLHNLTFADAIDPDLQKKMTQAWLANLPATEGTVPDAIRLAAQSAVENLLKKGLLFPHPDDDPDTNEADPDDFAESGDDE